jgi:hypothetical protein
MKRIAAQVILGLLCASASAGQPTWILMQNQHFRVLSSASERDTREVLNQFELISGFFSQVTKSKSISGEPVPVIIFGTEKEYQPYRLNEFATAYYFNQGDRDFIVVGKLGEQNKQTASHEYTHLELARAGFTLPPWLNEGIAELFSTLNKQGDFTLYGDVLRGRLQELSRQKWVPLETILDVDRNSPYYNESGKAGSFYDESWALVHMLATSEPYRDKFWSFVAEVSRGTDSAAALQQAYGMPLAKIEANARSYIEGNRFYQIKAKVPLDAAEKLTSQPADQFEVREMQAVLMMSFRDRQEEARSRLEALTQEDPKRPGPWADLGSITWRGGNGDKAAEYFGKAYDLGDRRPRMVLDYAHLVAPFSRERSVQVLQEYLVGQSDDVDARLFLGQMLVSLDRFEEALTAASPISAVKTDQERDDLLYLRAYSFLRLKYYDAARATAEKLRSTTTSDSLRSRAEDILRIAAQRASAAH